MCKQFFLASCLFLSLAVSLVAQSTAPPASAATGVPTLVRFGGALSGAPSRMVGVTFAFYKDQTGSSPLWLETQSVHLDATGHYSVQLGVNAGERLAEGTVCFR